MGMQTYKMLKGIMCRELDRVAERGEVTQSMLDTTHKLTDTIKNLLKIMALEEGGYSEDGWEMRRMPYNNSGSSYNSYGDNSYDNSEASYGRRGSHYVRGHYSMADGKEYLVSQMHEMIEDGNLSPQSRTAMRKAMEALERE